MTEVVVCVVGPDDAAADRLRPCLPAEVPIGRAGSRADALAAAPPADVVLLRPGCRVAPGWLAALRGAAYASSTTATATALTQHDVGATAESFEQAADRVHAGSLRLRPRTDAPGDACVYVRRSAIELVGSTGEDFFSQCVARGLAHVLADDVLVLDPGPTSAHQPTAAATRARSAARRAVHGLSVTIDARILAGPTTGTHVHVLELIAGLARTERVRLTAIVPDPPSADALARLAVLQGVSLVTYREAAEPGARPDIVHRPFQLSNAGDLRFLESLGERLILTQQDLIAFHNPAYFPTRETWHDYRHLTRAALASADRVLFFSAHARDDALSEELVDPARASVVHLGVDHPQPTVSPGAPPPGAERLTSDDKPAMLCLGTDFLHKNRLFALRILERLRSRHAWDGTLVFAGPAVAHGSSHPQEADFLATHPELAQAVLDVGPVGELEKNWLYNRSKLVVYPSVLEGFGLVPFEAAAHRVPCLWAPGTSLSELLPDEAAGIVPWDDAQTAAHALALLGEDGAREHNLNAIDAAASGLTWDATAAGLLDVYRATAEAPARTGSAGAAITLTEDAARLVGPGGELPEDVQRPLLALATHPRIAGPVFKTLKLGYRASYRLRRASQRRK